MPAISPPIRDFGAMELVLSYSDHVGSKKKMEQRNLVGG